MEIRKLKKKRKFKYISGNPLRVYYASYTPDGKVWCDGRSPHEVVGMSNHIPGVTYTKLEYFEVTNGDKPWTPDEAIINHEKTQRYADIEKIWNEDEEDEA